MKQKPNSFVKYRCSWLINTMQVRIENITGDVLLKREYHCNQVHKISGVCTPNKHHEFICITIRLGHPATQIRQRFHI